MVALTTQHRLTRQYRTNDTRTLTAALATAAANIENALLQVGAKPGDDYTHLDLMALAMDFLAMARDYDLTQEDIEPAPADDEPDGDPIIEALSKVLWDTNEVSILEAISKGLRLAPYQVTRDLQSRVGLALTKMGWNRIERRSGSARFVYVRPEQPTTEVL